MLITCVSTRWNSEYLMIKRIIEELDNVNEVLYHNKNHKKLYLRPSDKEMMKIFCETFEPFFNLTKKISSEKYPSSNSVIYSIFSLRKKYSSSTCDNNIIKFVKLLILESLNWYVREYKILDNSSLILASFLTPNRKKFAIIEDLLTRQQYFEKAKAAIKVLINSQIFKFPIEQVDDTDKLNDSLDDSNYLSKPLDKKEINTALDKELES
ncbi:unnamed protein product [Brachionus calyciflorus]|uniref:Uncharacterized protein n=1 Tax=Brachionus calyciflorus TaxID=104777 RepID=A0A814QL03_9BILA|nr:unnamed protein product [Brachionus calyciflorus]